MTGGEFRDSLVGVRGLGPGQSPWSSWALGRGFAGRSGSWSAFSASFPASWPTWSGSSGRWPPGSRTGSGPTASARSGLLQPIADAIKLITKEDLVPRNADRCGSPGRAGAGDRLGVPGDGGDPVRDQHGAGESPVGHGLPDRGLEHQPAGHLPGGVVEPQQVLAAGGHAVGRAARLVRSAPGALDGADRALGRAA